MHIDLPKCVKKIINRIYDNGFEAYAVGGCVRDSILGQSPSDWDIASSASPEEMMEIFGDWKVVPTGIQHGTITVILDNCNYEVTTYRIDGKYKDGRRPESVRFTRNLEEDLKRRDFTINAMAYNDRNGLVDYFDGIGDLSNKIIKCVGNTDERFSEDYLRMMRAYRFAATLDFELENDIILSCEKNKEKILDISGERIRMEFEKMILSDNFSMIKMFLDVFCEVLFPELYITKTTPQKSIYHYLNVYDHSLLVFENTPCDLDLRLTALFHDIGKYDTITTDEKGYNHFRGHWKFSLQKTFDILKRLKYDNLTINNVKDIVRHHDRNIRNNKVSIKKLIRDLEKEKALKVIQFQISDLLGKTDYAIKKKLDMLGDCLKIYEEIIINNEPCHIRELEIDGNDLINELGMSKGKQIGTYLNKLLEIVIVDPDKNKRDILLAYAESFERNKKEMNSN